MKLLAVSREGSEETTAAVLAGPGEVAIIGGAGGAPGFADVAAVFAAGEAGSAAAARALESDERLPLEAVTVRRPVLDPGAIVCVGLNYATHIKEMGRDLPTHPTLFSKPTRALTDPGAPIPLPSGCTTLDYEGELAIMIGRAGRDIDAASAWDHVGGLTVFNDTTVRDYQWRTKQWFAGKAWEASSPLGPQVVTADELGDVDQLELRVRVDGEERQRARLGDLVFGVAALVEDLSRIFTLRPGDVIATGTPGGVGAAMDPPGFLVDGSLVEVEIERIGLLANRVAA